MPADRACWNTCGSVGTIRAQWPVTISSTTKITPLSSHSASRAWCVQMVSENFFGVLPRAENRPSFVGVKLAGGRVS